MTDGRIRRATPADVHEIVTMVRDLAEYERAAHEVVATEEQFHDALFGPDPKVFAHVIEHESGEGNLGGFAIWFLNFSTWLGRHGLYLEDLYVRPALRGSGYGKALLATLAQECVETRIRQARVVGPRLERACPRLLPEPRRPSDG